MARSLARSLARLTIYAPGANSTTSLHEERLQRGPVGRLIRQTAAQGLGASSACGTGAGNGSAG